MKKTIAAGAILLVPACSGATVETAAHAQTADLSDCIRTAMQLDQGRWNYMGTIAQFSGKFRTYEAMAVHAPAGKDQWSSKSFGGDVGGDEASAEVSLVLLDGNAIVPIVDGQADQEGALNYQSCAGPDLEGRYEVHIEYKVPSEDGGFNSVKNMSWYSEHGSYFVEDHFTEKGRIIGRRAGVYTPAEVE